MKLTSFATVSPGYSARSRLNSTGGDGLLAVQLGDVPANGDEIEPAGLKRVALTDVPSKYLVAPGDVVFRSRGEATTAAVVGDEFQEPALVLLPLLILRPDQKRVDSAYLAWTINQPSAQLQLQQEAQGGGMRMVSKSAVDDLDLPLPDLKTQRLVVEAARLAQKQRELETKLATLRDQMLRQQLAAFCQSSH